MIESGKTTQEEIKYGGGPTWVGHATPICISFQVLIGFNPLAVYTRFSFATYKLLTLYAGKSNRPTARTDFNSFPRKADIPRYLFVDSS